MKPFSAAGLGSFFPAVAFLLAFAFCADAQARSLSLDLSGAGGGARQAARSVVAPVDSEEVRSHRLGAGAAKISGLETGDVIAFKLFQDKTLEVTLVEKTPSLSGRAFIGRIDNSLNALGCVVLETDDGVILDITDFERRRVWQVVSDANGVVVREIEPRNDKRCCGGELAPSRRRAANVSAAVAGISRGSKIANFLSEFGLKPSGDVNSKDFGALKRDVEALLAGKPAFKKRRDAAYEELAKRYRGAVEKLATLLK